MISKTYIGYKEDIILNSNSIEIALSYPYMTYIKTIIPQIIGIIITTDLYYSCQKKEPKERNTIMFNENIDSVRIMLHTMNAYLKKLPASAADEPHSYYIEDSAIYINGKKYETDTINFGSNSNKPVDFIKRNPGFIEVAFKLNKNGITASIPYINCHNALFYYRPTFQNHRGDSRFIVIIDSIGCNYLGVGNDTILDRYKDLALIADKSNPIYPTE